jgi:hypothetical protein
MIDRGTFVAGVALAAVARLPESSAPLFPPPAARISRAVFMIEWWCKILIAKIAIK